MLLMELVLERFDQLYLIKLERDTRCEDRLRDRSKGTPGLESLHT